MISFDGQEDLLRETDVLVQGVSKHKPGEQVAATVLRGGKKMELKLPMQK